MAHPKTLVTGATGKTGGALVAELLARGLPVRAIVRSRDARAVALEARGAEIAVADLFDPDQLRDAMRGVQRAYFVPPMHAHALQCAAVFVDAARDMRLEAIVQMSQWLSHRSHPALLTRQTWLMDRLFAASGMAVTVLNPGMFADNFLRTIDFAALLGTFPMLSGDGKAAPVSNEDIARVAAAVLAAPEAHAGKTYRPTGPQLLSGREMAAVVARAVGHPVRPVALPFWLFNKVARRQGVDAFTVAALRVYMADMKGGAFAFEGGVTDTVEALTGTPAESFETTARRYAAMPFARQTIGARLKALAAFLTTPLLPGYDLAAVAEAGAWPVAPQPTLSLDDPLWRAEHARIMAEQPSAGLPVMRALRVAS